MNWSRAVAALLVPPQRAFPHASYALSELCVLGVVCGEDSARIRLPSTRRRVVGVRFPDSCEDRHLCGRNTRWQSCGQRPIDPPGTPRPRPMLRGALWAGAAAGASRALKTLPLASRRTWASSITIRRAGTSWASRVPYSLYRSSRAAVRLPCARSRRWMSRWRSCAACTPGSPPRSTVRLPLTECASRRLTQCPRRHGAPLGRVLQCMVRARDRMNWQLARAEEGARGRMGDSRPSANGRYSTNGPRRLRVALAQINVTVGDLPGAGFDGLPSRRSAAQARLHP